MEYLTRGDCAIVVPQYALVPSALALKETREGEAQQELILAGIRDRIAEMPEGSRPRLVQFGESLGAEVALDVAAASGTDHFEELGARARASTSARRSAPHSGRAGSPSGRWSTRRA